MKDFTEAKRDELYRVLGMIDNAGLESFRVWSGRRGYEFGEWADRLGIYDYMRRAESFQYKVLEINSITRKQIEANFEGVGNIDVRGADALREYAETVKGQIRAVEHMLKFFDPHMGTLLMANKEKKVSGGKSITGINKRKLIETQDMTRSDSSYEEFISAIETAYGFDEMTAQSFEKIYKKLETKYEDNTAQIFFAVMASFSYGEVEGIKNAILWQIIASIPPIQLFGSKIFEQFGITEEEYTHMKNQILIQHMLCEMPQGLSASDLKGNGELNQFLNKEAEEMLGVSFEDLPEETKMLFYESYLDYCDKPDFTHMCATAATILYDGKEKELGNLAGIYNGIYSVDGNAGYVGDLYGTNGAKPSMGNADYMADLDAVNISNRVKNGKSVVDAISEYYVQLESGQINRAREFKYNIGEGDERMGLYILIKETETYHEYLEQLGNVEDIEYRKSMVRRFFNSLINEYNYLCEE